MTKPTTTRPTDNSLTVWVAVGVGSMEFIGTMFVVGMGLAVITGSVVGSIVAVVVGLGVGVTVLDGKLQPGPTLKSAEAQPTKQKATANKARLIAVIRRRLKPSSLWFIN
jgi:hypothetical protein